MPPLSAMFSPWVLMPSIWIPTSCTVYLLYCSATFCMVKNQHFGFSEPLLALIAFNNEVLMTVSTDRAICFRPAQLVTILTLKPKHTRNTPVCRIGSKFKLVILGKFVRSTAQVSYSLNPLHPINRFVLSGEEHFLKVYTFFENSTELYCQMFWLVSFDSWSMIPEWPLTVIPLRKLYILYLDFFTYYPLLEVNNEADGTINQSVL